MKKLTLNLYEIDVAGFEVVAPENGAGTVQGAEDAITRYTFCNDETCIPAICNPAIG